MVARYRRGGRLDPYFGQAGRVSLTITGDYLGEEGASISPYPGGRSLVGTESETGGALALLQPDGSLDRRFGQDGIARDFGLDAVVDFIVLPDGGVLAAGFDVEPCKARLARLHADGSPDASFGHGGVVNVEFLAGPCSGRNLNLALRPNGGIVLAGQTNVRLLRAFTPDGDPVKGFARGTAVRKVRLQRIGAVSIDKRGRIVLAGTYKMGQGLIRLTPRGRLDPSFGVRGRAVRHVGANATVADLRRDTDGGFVLAGRSKVCPELFCDSMAAVTRFTARGRVDRGFGRKGAWVGLRDRDSVIRTALLSRGAIFAGGWTSGGPDGRDERDLLLVRLHR
jgi:uncharacterized delta-60 repeat protein